MSHTTSTLHVRGIPLRRFVSAVHERMRARGYRPAANGARRLLVRKQGAWCTLVDTEGYDPRRDAGDAELASWGADLSQLLGRSVLTLWTWDGEASVVATRWKHGTQRSILSLLQEAYRDDDRVPRAPARVLWPWLPPARRGEILRTGVALVAPAAGSTGDAEVDALLADFDDEESFVNDVEEDEDFVFVEENVSLAGLGAAIGLRPWLDPWNPDAAVRELRFQTAASR